MHPSINAPINFNYLMPEEHPKNPYSPCWCLSGKKWKFCHKTRASEKSIHEKEYQRLVRKNYNQGKCLHPEASSNTCTLPAINSHTIQMNGGITTLSAAQHVYTFKLVDSMKSEIYEPKNIGIRKASTFLGFCKKHDSALFKVIETLPIEITQTTAFYMSYRAISYELHGKQRASAATPFMTLQDKGKPFEAQAWLQNYAHLSAQGYATGLRVHKQIKDRYDQLHLSADLTEFNFYAIEFSRPSPIVACGAFCPEFDIHNNPLQKLSQGTHDFQAISLNVLNLNDKSYAIFGWLDDKYLIARNYISALKEHPEELVADLILKICFQNLENTYISPEWWDSLSIPHKKIICSIFKTGIGTVPKTASSLLTTEALWRERIVRFLS
ncbi:hypothetical protein [Pseudomonas zeae]|uniref:SEC-C motif-containing protein n=1 Tax=Pseudomonas zeae TaxID=2745510 RepID=A0A9E6TAH1_9PSED|nr:hypothetical protein [Pseudomonas zeae]QXI10927.1 hypothetical protein HU754_024490 [Pseudomonas zeae]